MVTEIKFPDDLVEEAREDMYDMADIDDEQVDEIIDQALMILDVWNPSASGKAPSGVAATVVYVSSDVNSDGASELTQQELCEVFDTSPMTIRKQTSDCLSTARDEGVIQ